MHRCNHKEKSCIQASITIASEEIRASIVSVADEMVCDIDPHGEIFVVRMSPITASMQTEIHSAGRAFNANICNVSPLLQVTIMPMCDMEDRFLRVSPDVVWFTADDLDGANFEVMSNVVWTINIPQIDVIQTLTNDTRISNSSLLENGMQSQEAVDWLLNSTLIRNETMIRDVSTLVRAELSNSILLTNKHYLRNAI